MSAATTPTTCRARIQRRRCQSCSATLLNENTRGIEEAGHDNFKVVLRIRQPVQVIEGFGDLMGMMRKMKANAVESDSETGSVAAAIAAQQGQPDSPDVEEDAHPNLVEDSAGNLYHFDRVFRQNATQQNLWDEMLRDVTDTVLDGQDTLVFGSGACR